MIQKHKITIFENKHQLEHKFVQKVQKDILSYYKTNKRNQQTLTIKIRLKFILSKSGREEQHHHGGKLSCSSRIIYIKMPSELPHQGTA